MFYAKLNSAGEVEQYPYTLTDLRRDRRDTSFPRLIDAGTLARFGLVPVQPTEHIDDPTKNFTRTAEKQGEVWVEAWTESPADPLEITERTSARADSVRAERVEKLRACDWTQLLDAPGNLALRLQWASYRQQLRDLPTLPGFPWEFNWPVSP